MSCKCRSLGEIRLRRLCRYSEGYVARTGWGPQIQLPRPVWSLQANKISTSPLNVFTASPASACLLPRRL